MVRHPRLTTVCRPALVFPGVSDRPSIRTAESIRPNQSIQIMLSKTNVTSDPVSLRYSTSQLIEIVVRNIYGQEVWRYSWNRTFSPYGRLITIMPDGTQRISEIWNQRDNQGDPVYSGLYSISVQNLATGLNLTVQVEIS